MIGVMTLVRKILQKMKIMGKSSKPKTRKQIIKWLNNPHSDSAEYKMWGNGVALPCVCFVLTGIVLSARNTAD